MRHPVMHIPFDSLHRSSSYRTGETGSCLSSQLFHPGKKHDERVSLHYTDSVVPALSVIRGLRAFLGLLLPTSPTAAARCRRSQRCPFHTKNSSRRRQRPTTIDTGPSCLTSLPQQMFPTHSLPRKGKIYGSTCRSHADLSFCFLFFFFPHRKHALIIRKERLHSIKKDSNHQHLCDPCMLQDIWAYRDLQGDGNENGDKSLHHERQICFRRCPYADGGAWGASCSEGSWDYRLGITCPGSDWHS